MIWLGVLATSLGCYLQKLTGMSVPQRLLDSARVQVVSAFIPIALLAALTAVQVFGRGQGLMLDARVGGLVFAFIALKLRAPFVVVVIGAALIAAVLRLAGVR